MILPYNLTQGVTCECSEVGPSPRAEFVNLTGPLLFGGMWLGPISCQSDGLAGFLISGWSGYGSFDILFNGSG